MDLRFQKAHKFPAFLPSPGNMGQVIGQIGLFGGMLMNPFE
ncbi:hypothetical protein ADIS_2000 [Lunatimonas lonarensis]|uniref:Uncharacterized protein n=1 Tax=Lunatimonas lonarensis TaxID=1232681 RepID=R7ZTL8_9BACT|nr:hypothetical protein ADIS_2000 [Lunatimonas lonarensis]